MLQTKVVKKIKTQFYGHCLFFRKFCCICDNVEKYGEVRHATNENIIWRMRKKKKKIYIGLHVKYPLFLSDFNET
jgi:hypothetical protein